jgi:hypothetical protein
MWNIDSPDSPTAEREAIQAYREKFIKLLCQIGTAMGGASSVTIDYRFALIPEVLPLLGYTNIMRLTNQPTERSGRGETLVVAHKGDETVILEKTSNLFSPWGTIRHVPWQGKLDPKHIIKLLTF